MLKRISCILIVFALCAPLAAASAAHHPPSHWAQREIEKALALDFIPDELQSGYRDAITRAEFAKIALFFAAMQRDTDVEHFFEAHCAEYAAAGTPIAYRDDVFSDTHDEYVNRAYALGIVSGRGNGVFDPDSPITRQEAAVMLLNTFFTYGGGIKHQEKIMRFRETFGDRGDIADWAADSVLYMWEWGVMNGVADDIFAPTEHYTREQCIATFVRLYENGPDSRHHGNVPAYHH